jgi:protein TonB
MKVGMIAVTLVAGLLLSAGVIPLASGEEEPTHRVSEEEATKAVKSKVTPEYPAMARQMKLVGTVMVDVFIDTGGKVEKVQVVRGNPLLTSAAATALKRWTFLPFTSEGKAVRTVAGFTFSFKQ